MYDTYGKIDGSQVTIFSENGPNREITELITAKNFMMHFRFNKSCEKLKLEMHRNCIII